VGAPFFGDALWFGLLDFFTLCVRKGDFRKDLEAGLQLFGDARIIWEARCLGVLDFPHIVGGQTGFGDFYNLEALFVWRVDALCAGRWMRKGFVR